MRRLTFYSILPVLSVLVTINGITDLTPTRTGIAIYLPTSGELKPWKSFGPREVYKGEALYLWIDGGASIYLEYGFEQAVTEQYLGPDSQMITLELYEMEDPASAYGIYTFKRGREGASTRVGREGWMEEYYLNFWKGKHLATLIASESDDQSIKDLLTIAKIVATKLPNRGSRPPLVDFLPTANLDSGSITYLQGPLALGNSYSFGGEDAFGVGEAVVGTYGEVQLFIFYYGDESECRERFNKIRAHFQEEGRDQTSQGRGGISSFLNAEGRQIHMKLYSKYIFIAIGADESIPETIFEDIEEEIEKSTSSERW